MKNSLKSDLQVEHHNWPKYIHALLGNLDISMIKLNQLLKYTSLCLCAFAFNQANGADFAGHKGNLSGNIRIESEVFNYSLQYRVYTPPGMQADVKLPTIYLADGQWYIGSGNMIDVLDKEIN
jgi:enterochelin esterase-like enzyme